MQFLQPSAALPYGWRRFLVNQTISRVTWKRATVRTSLHSDSRQHQRISCVKPDDVKRVLLVDDSETLRRHLRNMFESDGFVCQESEDGAQAVEQAEQFKPHIIVLDFSMPVMNGLQAIPLLKSKLAATPIIMFTLFADARFLKLAMAAGAATVISKDDVVHLLPRANSLLRFYS